MTPRMHADQVGTDVGLVRELVAGQFPQWADLPLEPVVSCGTDHDIYRLGDDLSVRLPRTAWAVAQAVTEATWLPVLAPRLPLRLPVPKGVGHPADGYPHDWSVTTWLPGHDALGPIDDLDRAADGLAGFVAALRRVDTAGAHPRQDGRRGCPLHENDTQVRASIAQLGDRVDAGAALRSWEQSLEVGAHDGAQVWLHGDLLPGNLIVVDGRLSAVIDWGALNVGDPACDLQPAWNLFAGASRQRFLDVLEVDDAAWLRGRGTVLYQTVMALPYYWDTNPGFVRQASRALAEVLADPSRPGAR